MRVAYAGSDRWLSHRVRELIGLDGVLLEDYEPGESYDLVVSVLYEKVFTKGEIERQGCGIVNLHPAPLPEYRGCNSYSHAILNGDAYYAVTLHYVDEGIDTGPVIAQKWLPIHDDDTAWRLYQRAQCVALELFETNWPRVLRCVHQWERVRSIPQSFLELQREARYYPRNSLDAYHSIPECATVAEAETRIRALTFPGKPSPVRQGAAAWPF